MYYTQEQLERLVILHHIREYLIVAKSKSVVSTPYHAGLHSQAIHRLLSIQCAITIIDDHIRTATIDMFDLKRAADNYYTNFYSKRNYL